MQYFVCQNVDDKLSEEKINITFLAKLEEENVILAKDLNWRQSLLKKKFSSNQEMKRNLLRPVSKIVGRILPFGKNSDWE